MEWQGSEMIGNGRDGMDGKEEKAERGWMVGKVKGGGGRGARKWAWKGGVEGEGRKGERTEGRGAGDRVEM